MCMVVLLLCYRRCSCLCLWVFCGPGEVSYCDGFGSCCLIRGWSFGGLWKVFAGLMPGVLVWILRLWWLLG